MNIRYNKIKKLYGVIETNKIFNLFLKILLKSQNLNLFLMIKFNFDLLFSTY